MSTFSSKNIYHIFPTNIFCNTARVCELYITCPLLFLTSGGLEATNSQDRVHDLCFIQPITCWWGRKLHPINQPPLVSWLMRATFHLYPKPRTLVSFLWHSVPLFSCLECGQSSIPLSPEDQPHSEIDDQATRPPKLWASLISHLDWTTAVLSLGDLPVLNGSFLRIDLILKQCLCR